MDYPFLFSPAKLGSFHLRNRLTALPVHTGFAHTDGRVSSWMVDFYRHLARSGPSMVVVANTAVSQNGVLSKFNLRADRDEFIPGLADLARAIKGNGAKACLQLNHAGRFANTDKPMLPSPITHSNLAFNLESLKEFMEFFPFEKRFGLTRTLVNKMLAWRSPMTQSHRQQVISDFAAASARALEAGFDMVELHGANGYLLCQYLSSFTNQLPPPYGGGLKDRAGFPLAVVRAVKESLPEDFPVGFRLLTSEWVPNGIDLPQAIRFSKLLEKHGIAYLSASAGTYNSLFSKGIPEKISQTAYLAPDMERLTRHVNIPTIISGRITTPEVAETLIEKGVADLIGLGRPIRTDPDWVTKARQGHGKITQCINCNWCLGRVILEKGFNCRLWPHIKREKTSLAHKLLTRNRKALWVIGGKKDIEIFNAALPLLSGLQKNTLAPRVLFLRQISEDPAFERAKQTLLTKIRNLLDPLEFWKTPWHYTITAPLENWEKIVGQEAARQGYGRIHIGANSSQPWRQRFLYSQRGKILSLIRPNIRMEQVLVPLDLSGTSLMIMGFLAETLMKEKEYNCQFIHAGTSPSRNLARQWEKMKAISGMDALEKAEEKINLKQIPLKTDVASSLALHMETSLPGTIVMGKRGLSGIKRWLLGSVSSGVMKRIKDQSLFLID